MPGDPGGLVTRSLDVTDVTIRGQDTWLSVQTSLWCSLLLLLLAGQCLSTVPHGLSLALTTLTLAQAGLHSAMSASAACPPEPLAEARPGFPLLQPLLVNMTDTEWPGPGTSGG